MPMQIAAWLTCLLAVFFLINEGGKVLDRWRGKPGQPANESLKLINDALEKRLATLEHDFKTERDENEKHISERSRTLFIEIKAVHHELSTKIDRQMELSEESRARLHERINPIVENTAEIKGRMEAFTSSFGNFSEVMQTQTEAILAQTKAIEHLAKAQSEKR